RDEPADAADATRARGVATIDAQPSSPSAPVITPPPGFSPPAPTAAAADATQLRGAQRVDAQPVASAPRSEAGAPAAADELPAATVIRGRVAAPVEPEKAEEAPRSRAGRVIVWTASVVAAVVVVAIVVSIAIFGVPSQSGKAAPTHQAGAPDSAVVDTIPAPTLVSARAEGSTVVFTVKNPKPREGDAFVWKRTDRTTDAAMQATTDPTITVDGYAPGATVCIEVGIRRAGQVSAEPLQPCYPK